MAEFVDFCRVGRYFTGAGVLCGAKCYNGASLKGLDWPLGARRGPRRGSRGSGHHLQLPGQLRGPCLFQSRVLDWGRCPCSADPGVVMALSTSLQTPKPAQGGRRGFFVAATPPGKDLEVNRVPSRAPFNTFSGFNLLPGF